MTTTAKPTASPPGVVLYRKKPAEPEVHAVQLLDADDLDWYAIATWCGGKVGVQAVGDSGEFDAYIEMPGGACAFEGAWIVREPSGFRIREDFVFAEVYEPADSDGVASWTLTRLSLIGALRSLPVTAVLSMLESEGGRPEALADAILGELGTTS